MAFIAATALGGLWLFVHGLVLYGVFRDHARRPAPRPGRPWLAVLPPLAPWVAWRSGARGLPLAWVALALAYAAARALV
jgi:hypothetical protein